MNAIPNTPWLPEWRTFADETFLDPKSRRFVEEAIRTTAQHWEQKHAETYRERSQRRFSARDEKVVSACEEMSRRLREIRREVKAGRMDPKDARAEVRSMHGRYNQARDLHDTLIGQEDDLKAFSEMTPDDYQREFLDRFPVLLQTAPRLAGLVDQAGRVQAGGGELRPTGHPVGFDAPSVEDLTVN